MGALSRAWQWRSGSGSGRCARSDNGEKAAESGFTLVELLVVLVILVLLAGLVAPRVIGYLGSSRTKTAKVQIQSLSTALELYKVDTGRYPTTGEGLKALTEAPPGTPAWNGPYLTRKEVPGDPWGRPYTYRSPGEHGPFDIASLGADNQPGGSGENEDIVSW
jgi:general secretion pathway protein G